MFHQIDRNRDYCGMIPAGTPIYNRIAILIDESGHKAKSGAIGELYIRSGLPFVGYYRDKELSDKVFVVNPLNPYYNERIYKTGDLARVNEYGEIEIVGRVDTMIKHHGYRIVPEEIEHCSLESDGVTECCCSYNAEQEQIILIYSGTIGQIELLMYLRGKLPSYMIPGRVEKLDILPHTPNGKIDRKKLSVYDDTHSLGDLYDKKCNGIP